MSISVIVSGYGGIGGYGQQGFGQQGFGQQGVYGQQGIYGQQGVYGQQGFGQPGFGGLNGYNDYAQGGTLNGWVEISTSLPN